MSVKQNIQGQAAVDSRRTRFGQRLILAIGLVVAGVVGLLVLTALPLSTPALTEQSAQNVAQIREQLGVSVAPVDQGQIDALVREHTQREQLGLSVAPVNQAQIDALVREHGGREQLGVSVAPANQGQIDALVREDGGQGQ